MFDLRNCDCMDLMKQYPDKHFDLAIVDPPYGINAGCDNRLAINSKSGNNLKRYGKPGGIKWDKKTPDANYFNELLRVSKNQIIWGGNYFLDFLGKTRCMICWDKLTFIPSMSRVEIAWTSFSMHSQLVVVNSNQTDRFHISQKPIPLYRWLLSNYAKAGDLILDTHLGSGSIAIACHDLGFDLVGSELDADYFAAMNERISRHTAQGNLFKPQIEAEDDVRQHSLFPAPEASA